MRPTELERRYGRFMRAPDHDAGTDTGGDDAGTGDQVVDTGSDGDDAVTDLAAATTDAGAGDKDGEDKADEKGDADQPVVPEAYELKITTQDAEGKDVDVEIDTALLTEATPILKELNLTNEQANKLAPLAVKVQEKLLSDQADSFAATKADWAKETQADPEIGGKNWKETTSLVGKALDHFAGGAEKNEDGSYKSEFRQLLTDTGLTNHPAMAKMLRSIGAAIAEDGTFARSEGKTVRKSPEEVNYPDDVPKK